MLQTPKKDCKIAINLKKVEKKCKNLLSKIMETT